MDKAYINIYLNSKPQTIHAQACISDLLSAVNVTSHNGIALAVNNNVVPKAEWSTYELNPDDKVMLIRATQGG